MAAYAVIARIDRVSPHLAGHAPSSDDAWSVSEPIDPPEAVDLAGPPPAPTFADRWADIREAWSQTTFYLFDAEGWR